MSRSTENYLDNAKDDAQNTVSNFSDEILEQLLNKGEASDDLLNDYPNGDAWHHECHVDKNYDLQEAAALLDQLDEFEETDSGLWEGLEPRRAIAAQAAYTYGNAVYHQWRKLIEGINDEAATIIEEYDDIVNVLETAIDDLHEQADNALPDDEEKAVELTNQANEKQAELDGIKDQKQEALLDMLTMKAQ